MKLNVHNYISVVEVVKKHNLLMIFKGDVTSDHSNNISQNTLVLYSSSNSARVLGVSVCLRSVEPSHYIWLELSHFTLVTQLLCYSVTHITAQLSEPNEEVTHHSLLSKSDQGWKTV